MKRFHWHRSKTAWSLWKFCRLSPSYRLRAAPFFFSRASVKRNPFCTRRSPYHALEILWKLLPILGKVFSSFSFFRLVEDCAIVLWKFCGNLLPDSELEVVHDPHHTIFSLSFSRLFYGSVDPKGPRKVASAISAFVLFVFFDCSRAMSAWWWTCFSELCWL